MYQSSSLNNFKLLVNYHAFLQADQDTDIFYKAIKESKLLFFTYQNIPTSESTAVPLTSLVFEKEVVLSSQSVFNHMVEPFNINLD